MESIFYKLEKDIHKDVLLYALSVASRAYVDKKEDGDWDRQFDPDMSPSEAIDVIMEDHKHHFVFIHRQNQEQLSMLPGHSSYFEVGGCTMGKKPETFLFLYLTEKDAGKIIKKYKIHDTL